MSRGLRTALGTVVAIAIGAVAAWTAVRLLWAGS